MSKGDDFCDGCVAMSFPELCSKCSQRSSQRRDDELKIKRRRYFKQRGHKKDHRRKPRQN